MKKLLKNKKGFTLMEMLIVVAIIVILVAISIPVFTSQVGEANTATDAANVRAAKAMAAVEFLDSGKTGVSYYDAVDGRLEADDSQITAYGKGSTAPAGSTGTPKDNIIKVEIAADGTATLSWVAITD